MALIWAESFDLYGTSRTELALRGYSKTGSANTTMPSNAGVARTGTGYIQLATNSNEQMIARVADTNLNTCVQGVGIYFDSTPTTNRRSPGIAFRVGTEYNEIQVNGNAELGISVWRGVPGGTGTVIGSSAPNLLTVGTWFWLEAKLITGTGTASIEVRLNGDTILTITGLTVGQVTGYGIGKPSHSGYTISNVKFDDWIVGDTDFFGERRCVTTFPDADTVEADWTPSSGSSGFAMIDETTPSDADYIEAANPGDISEFEKASIGIGTNDVAGVVVIARALKTDAGANSFRIGVHSGAFVQNSDEKLPNTTVAYFSEIFPLDPNGDIPWTRNAIDNANIRFTRET